MKSSWGNPRDVPHVTTAQKLDEITAQRDAAIATERAAKAQYDMARNGAEAEDKLALGAVVVEGRGEVAHAAGSASGFIQNGE